MDEVKKYLFENRDELDLEKAPRPQVWKRIQQETATTPKRVISIKARWIAAAAAVIAVATLLTLWLNRPDTQPVVAQGENSKPASGPELSGQEDSTRTEYVQESREDSSKETIVNNTPKVRKHTPSLAKNDPKPVMDKKPLSPLEAVEDNYAVMINRQLKKLSTTPIYVEDAGYFHVFKKQWLDMQRDELELKQDIRHYGFTDNVVKQLIQMYQQKLKLLKDLQTEINKMNIRAKQHPALERLKPAYLKL